jgi:hypothetical protein
LLSNCDVFLKEVLVFRRKDQSSQKTVMKFSFWKNIYAKKNNMFYLSALISLGRQFFWLFICLKLYPKNPRKKSGPEERTGPQERTFRLGPKHVLSRGLLLYLIFWNNRKKIGWLSIHFVFNPFTAS